MLNGNLTIVDPAGNAASHYEPPSGSSPFFGWLGSDGFTTVRIDKIQAICANPQRSDQYLIVMDRGNLLINRLDAERLMKRMGWQVPKGI